MIGVTKRLVSRPLFSTQTLRRGFSVKAIYPSFPATLLYYRPHQKLSLYDEKEGDSRPDDLFQDRVKLGEDGLVYPGVSQSSSESLSFQDTDKR